MQIEICTLFYYQATVCGLSISQAKDGNPPSSRRTTLVKTGDPPRTVTYTKTWIMRPCITSASRSLLSEPFGS